MTSARELIPIHVHNNENNSTFSITINTLRANLIAMLSIILSQFSHLGSRTETNSLSSVILGGTKFFTIIEIRASSIFFFRVDVSKNIPKPI